MNLIIIFFFVVGLLMAFGFIFDDLITSHNFKKRSSRPLIDFKPPKKRHTAQVGNYKRAKGVIPYVKGDELPEQTVRRMRGHK